MIGWLLKKTAKAQAKPVAATRPHEPANCPLWHDVARALDSKPRAAK